jgi:lipoprotein-releasing system ATP-binding protein
MKPVLSAKNISKRFVNPSIVDVLIDVSLDIYPGKSIAITGKSGEGKSTLLHILGTLEKPTSGTLLFADEGLDIYQLRNQKIGFVFQTFNLLEDLTALENVAFPARIAGREASEALSLLTDVGLQDRAHFPVKLLSGGEKQRVAIARALCNSPDIILADEPSGNLDRAHSSQIHDLLLNATKQRGTALVIVTHDTELANLCDEKYHLKAGRLCSY